MKWPPTGRLIHSGPAIFCTSTWNAFAIKSANRASSHVTRPGSAVPGPPFIKLEPGPGEAGFTVAASNWSGPWADAVIPQNRKNIVECRNRRRLMACSLIISWNFICVIDNDHIDLDVFHFFQRQTRLFLQRGEDRGSTASTGRIVCGRDRRWPAAG